MRKDNYFDHIKAKILNCHLKYLIVISRLTPRVCHSSVIISLTLFSLNIFLRSSSEML